MYLKSDRITVTLAGETFRVSSTTPAPSYQFILDPEAIAGWYDGVGVRRDSTIRPNQWGDFADPARKGSRTLTLTGTAVATSVANLQEARDRFIGLLQDGGYREMQVRAATDTARGVERNIEERYISVGLEGTPSWVRLSDTVAVWKLDLYAPNPRIYGPKRDPTPIGDGSISGGLKFPLVYPLNYGTVRSDQVYLTNEGNTDSWPTFVVTGDFPTGFHIKNNNGSVVTYLGMVSTKAPVTINMESGTATQNGSDRTVNLSRRDWFSIPPHSSMRPSFEPLQDGFGWCDIIYRDTWI